MAKKLSREKKPYGLRLDKQNTEFIKEVVEKMGFSLSQFIDQVFAGYVAVFKEAGLHEKDMTEWTMNDMARFFSAFQKHNPKGEKENEGKQKGE